MFIPVAVLLPDSSLVVSIVGEVEEAESAVLSQSLAVEEESDGEQETAAEGEESERVGSGAFGEIREYVMKHLGLCVSTFVESAKEGVKEDIPKAVPPQDRAACEGWRCACTAADTCAHTLTHLCLLCCTDAGSLKLLLTYLPKLKLVCAAVEEVNLQGFSDGRCTAFHHTTLYTVNFPYYHHAW